MGGSIPSTRPLLCCMPNRAPSRPRHFIDPRQARWPATLAALAMLSGTARASGTIYYGSRVGMEVEVVSMSGLSSADAVIRTKHTRQNAVTFCREYVGKVTAQCIRDELAIPLNDSISADCPAGTFTDFRGNRYRFAGPSKDKDSMAKYRLIDLSTNEEADGSSASGYPTNMGLFRALCPMQAPDDAD